MPSGSYKQVYVQCPFYKYDDGKRRITCEGITDACSLTLCFKTRLDYEIQMKTFCCDRYAICEVCRMLIKKYEEED